MRPHFDRTALDGGSPKAAIHCHALTHLCGKAHVADAPTAVMYHMSWKCVRF
jgi:hypothetical protein